MKMPKKTGVIFVVMGAVLILSALLLFCYNQREDAQAGLSAQAALEGVQAAIVKRAQDNTAEHTEQAAEASEEPTLVEIEGYDYIGYLSIPALGLELPVMAEWDYHRLQLAPCRQAGSVDTDDLVIAGHNYRNHFKYLYKLNSGDTLTFTNTDNIKISYTVKDIQTVSPDSVDTVLNSGYDMVLYTCSYGGKTRVAVFCDRTEIVS